MKPASDLAASIAAALFRNGFGSEADRLVLTVDGPPPRDLGGWCRQAVADLILRHLRAGDFRGPGDLQRAAIERALAALESAVDDQETSGQPATQRIRRQLADLRAPCLAEPRESEEARP